MSALDKYATINVYGVSVVKYDLIAVVISHGLKLFDVYRRYNNSHQIMIHDSRNNHIYFNQNCTIKKSIQTILLLSPLQISLLSTNRCYSIKNSITIYEPHLLNKYWFDIQDAYQTIVFEISGLPMMGLEIELNAISPTIGNKRKFSMIDEKDEIPSVASSSVSSTVSSTVSIDESDESDQDERNSYLELLRQKKLNNKITSIQAM